MATFAISEKIVSSPEMVGGQPRIAGTRFTVKQIVTWHEYMGRSADEIATEYGLELSDIYAALSYFFDHQEEILQSIQSEDTLVKALKNKYPSKIATTHG